VINRVIEITDVGRFLACHPKGDTSFKPLTVVYAENGRGKTTLAAILRSLRLGDCLPMVERAAVTGSGAPRVKLMIDGKPVTGDSTAWTRVCPEVDVFDAAFVEANVFSGSGVGADQRRSLHTLAIGPTGVSLANRVEGLAGKIAKVNGPLKITEDAVKVLAGDGISVSAFCGLSRVDDVEKQIEIVSRDLNAAESKTLIEDTDPFATIAIPEVPIESVRTQLGATLEGVSADAVARTRQHIVDSLNESGELWLDQGLGYLKDDDECPFCGRSVEGIPLVEAYKQYFDEAYSEHVGKTTELAEQAKTKTSPAESAGIQRVVDDNAKVAAIWTSFGVEWKAALDTAELQDRLHRLGEAIGGALDEKANAPLNPAATSAELDDAVHKWDLQCERIGEYNAAVATAIASIVQIKASAGTADVNSLRSRKDSLNKVKLRYEEASAVACDSYLGLREKKKRLEAEKAQAWKDLEAESKVMIESYAGAINGYLERFGTQFRLCDPAEDRHGGTPRFDYCIDIDGCSVPLETTVVGKACFGNTLSAGDKNALASAFYLAKLRRDGDLTKKTIVLDDPICSLDMGRKASTRQEIQSLLQDASQVIVMSHDALFLRDVWSDAEPSERAALKVTRDGRDSTIVVFDIERETQAQYYGDYVRLTEFMTGASGAVPRDVARAIRPLLEGNLRLRFPGKVGSRRLGDFLQDVADAAGADPLAVLTPLLAEIRQINDYAKMFHHDENPAASSQPVNEGELRAYCKRALRIVSQVLAV
jgi:wobble nucleotide-excising tRNase